MTTVFAVLLSRNFCYRSLGYRYNEDGEIEEQNRFINRMSGIMRLYAAILVTRPCGYQQKKIHPHGLSQAWRWIACILNMGNYFLFWLSLCLITN